MKVNSAHFGHSPGEAPDNAKSWVVCTDDSESKPAKLLRVVENRRELGRNVIGQCTDTLRSDGSSDFFPRLPRACL